jgi:hypothetical protein
VSLKKSLVSLLFTIIPVLVLFVLLNPTVGHALSCPLPPANLVALCENNSCKEGFAVQYQSTGNWCDTRPVVVKSDYTEEKFLSVAEKINMGLLYGVYELTTSSLWCLEDWEGEYCPNNTSIKKRSSSPTLAELDRLKVEWEQKEKDGLRIVTTGLWSVSAIIAGVVSLAILWPWILIKIWHNLRRRLSLLLIIAILPQVLLFLILSGDPFVWSHNLWGLTASASSVVLGLSIVGHIIILIVRRIRYRSVTSQNSLE